MKQSRIRKLNKEGYQRFLSGLSEQSTPQLYKTVKEIIYGKGKDS